MHAEPITKTSKYAIYMEKMFEMATSVTWTLANAMRFDNPVFHFFFVIFGMANERIDDKEKKKKKARMHRELDMADLDRKFTSVFWFICEKCKKVSPTEYCDQGVEEEPI